MWETECLAKGKSLEGRQKGIFGIFIEFAKHGIWERGVWRDQKAATIQVPY